ncbi:methyltransferase domain-containing protein [Halolamina sp. C58]|uniref:class I SAM-dependent methyltransferase n=1 Tax=Halolamina sp. C58 TaxID=3421640 RepID=UPI003EBF710D
MPTDESPSHPLFAAVYDPVTKHAEERLLEEHREYLATDLHGAVLDLGAGTGAMFPYFKSATDNDSSLILHAVEPDPHMRRQAVQKARSLDLDITIRSEGAQSLPYADDAFDVVIASLVFCTIPDVEAALDEVTRVLKPGGEFRFFEHVHAEGLLARLQDVVNPVWRRAAAGCHLNRDTVTTFRHDDRFEMTEFDELGIGIPPVAPFVRGTLVAHEGSRNPWQRVFDSRPRASILE